MPAQTCQLQQKNDGAAGPCAPRGTSATNGQNVRCAFWADGGTAERARMDRTRALEGSEDQLFLGRQMPRLPSAQRSGLSAGARPCSLCNFLTPTASRRESVVCACSDCVCVCTLDGPNDKHEDRGPSVPQPPAGFGSVRPGHATPRE